MSKLKAFLMTVVISILGIYFAENVLCADQATNDLTTKSVSSEQTARCIQCHKGRQKRLIDDWEKSAHAKNGVGCYECHSVEPGNPSGKNGHFGFVVSLAVTPDTCGKCHAEEFKSFASSSHALAFDLVADVASQSIATSNGIIFERSCAMCHGNSDQFERGVPINNRWPNHGIGRINADGSRGNCAACHSKHDFSLAKVRDADTCGRCHHGQPGPMKEIWEASRHGNSFEIANKDVDFSRRGFMPFRDGVKIPNCYVCHMAGVDESGKGKTHDPAERISWSLAGMPAAKNANWGSKRNLMKTMCRNCHGNSQINGYYSALDKVVFSCNDFGKVHENLIASMSPVLRTEFKRALKRMKFGAAMMSPIHVTEGESRFKVLLDGKN